MLNWQKQMVADTQTATEEQVRKEQEEPLSAQFIQIATTSLDEGTELFALDCLGFVWVYVGTRPQRWCRLSNARER